MPDLARVKTFSQLSRSTTATENLPRFSNVASSFTSNILIVGGSYSGLAALRSLQTKLSQRFIQLQAKEKQNSAPITITLVEPKNGLLNIIGIPKSVVDPKFAKTQYIPFCQLKHVKFTTIISNDDKSIYNEGRVDDNGESESWYDDKKNDTFEGVNVRFVQGKVTHLDQYRAQYVLNNVADSGSHEGTIEFDYVILASGRDRAWPVTPRANTMSEYMEDMERICNMIRDANNSSVIGAGAVGIELAADIKTKFPEKTVNLIHPYEHFPSEPQLSTEFKQMVQDSIERSGVNVYLNTRINTSLSASESSQSSTFLSSYKGDLVTQDTKKVIHSDLNLWCTSKTNNISFLSSDLASKYVTNGDIDVNDYLQLSSSSSPTIPNFFVLGDLVNLPIIKSAGWAMYMGRQTANNITSMIFENGQLVEPMADLKNVPKGMVLVGGNDEIISELAGEVQLNHEWYKKEYLDYCIGKIRATLDV
ncbi:hypothetical protein KGF56_001547 [Candida oxycetoniae]|uniref:FAD/NAD(P)-binding domain-containing protein n=1 Tax=Candida oxycetoniae TaxID=497107 RepID=A0AAI9WYZ5_9ASCO|nr:uncharacterized protein KGF56_001547 [Candida oxycetoniae]KAI3405529.2 hypothetical protein KGF56_001547 [Candida oxycetoniae]